MTVIGALALGVVYGTGVYLILQRSLTRIVIGLSVMAHGANLLLLLSAGDPGVAPIVGLAPTDELADPLPQALALTAIVISFGILVFLLSLAYRSWMLTGDDLAEDDEEDRRIAAAAAVVVRLEAERLEAEGLEPGEAVERARAGDPERDRGPGRQGEGP